MKWTSKHCFKHDSFRDLQPSSAGSETSGPADYSRICGDFPQVVEKDRVLRVHLSRRCVIPRI